MSTARLLTSALAATALSSAAFAGSLPTGPTGGFIAVGDVGNATSTRDTVTFFSTADLSSPLFTVALPFEGSPTNNEDFSTLTVNPTTGDVYALAFDSGTTGTVAGSSGILDGQPDTDGDSDLYRIDFNAFYNDWAANHGTYVSYYTQVDTFFGDPIFGSSPNPVQATGSLATDGIVKVGEVATSRASTTPIFNSTLSFIDEDTLVLLDNDTTDSGLAADDHEIRVIKRTSTTAGSATYDEITNEGGFNNGTAETWQSTIVGRVQLDGETNNSEPRNAAAYRDPATGVTGLWIVEGDGGGDDIGFFEITNESGTLGNGFRPATTGFDAFALDDNPVIDPATNDGSGDRILVDPTTGNLVIVESGFFDTPQDEPSIITREVLNYDATGEILFGAWGFNQLDGAQPGDDDSAVVDSRQTVYDFANNTVYFWDQDNPGAGGSFDGDWWSLNLTTGESALVATDAGNFQTFGNGTYMGFFNIGDLPGLLGDYDESGELTIADVDILVAAILASSTDSQFDLNGDSLVNAGDLTEWIEGLFGTLLGDANLDGEVDLIDLSNLATNFNGPAGYSGGDFNADGLVDLIDLSTLATNFGASAAVPEPASLALLGLGTLALTRRSH